MMRWDRTHEALCQAAMKMFRQYGYEATSTAAIAERAGVSEMTLFRHFQTKEALLFEDPFDPSNAKAIRRRPGPEAPMLSVAEGIRQALTRVEPGSVRSLRERLRIVAQTDSLTGAIERNSAQTVAAIVGALVERGVAEAHAQVAARAVVAGLGAALLDWAQADDRALITVLEEALDVLGGH